MLGRKLKQRTWVPTLFVIGVILIINRGEIPSLHGPLIVFGAIAFMPYYMLALMDRNFEDLKPTDHRAASGGQLIGYFMLSMLYVGMGLSS